MLRVLRKSRNLVLFHITKDYEHDNTKVFVTIDVFSIFLGAGIGNLGLLDNLISSTSRFVSESLPPEIT